MHVYVLALVFHIITGVASQYAPGRMQEVIGVRQSGATAYDLPETLPEVDGYITLLEPDLIGEIVYIRPQGHTEWRSMLVVDCAGHADGGYHWMQSDGIIAEVDYETAVAWDTVGSGIVVELRYPAIIKTKLLPE